MRVQIRINQMTATHAHVHTRGKGCWSLVLAKALKEGVWYYRKSSIIQRKPVFIQK